MDFHLASVAHMATFQVCSLSFPTSLIKSVTAIHHFQAKCTAPSVADGAVVADGCGGFIVAEDCAACLPPPVSAARTRQGRLGLADTARSPSAMRRASSRPKSDELFFASSFVKERIVATPALARATSRVSRG